MLVPAMSPGAYLARVVTARPLYCLLFKEAMGVLAPSADTCRREPIVCGLSIAVLADRLGQSRSVVGEEMRRLVSHGWVMAGPSRMRLLGHRLGAKPMLLSDIKAEEACGERDVVSRFVLAWAPDTATGTGGTARRYQR
jgi:hypothetical protein